LGIISDELRIKDMEFVEKHLEALKKITNRGGQSLEVKQKKEEEVIVQKVLKHLQEEKDVRKGDWNNKEVLYPYPCSCLRCPWLALPVALFASVRITNENTVLVLFWMCCGLSGECKAVDRSVL